MPLFYRHENEEKKTGVVTAPAQPAQAVSASVRETTPLVQERVRAARTSHSAKRRGAASSLLRGLRASRRRRLAALTLLLAAGMGARWHWATATPTFPANATVAAPTIVGPNSAHFYAAAADTLDMDRYGSFDVEGTPAAEVRAAVAENAEALALLRTGFAHRYYGQATNWMKTRPAESISAPVQNFVAQRTLARLLVADARVKAARREVGGALSASLDAVRFGQDIGHGGTLIGGMVGTLVDALGGKEGLKHVTGLTAAEARDGAQRLENLLANELTFAEMLESDRRMVLGTYAEWFSGPHYGANSLISEEIDTLRYSGLLLQYGKQGLVDNYTGYMDEAVRRARLPYNAVRRMNAIPMPSDTLSRIAIPNMERARLQRAKGDARNRILLARLALEAYRLEHGGIYPMTLTHLRLGENRYLTAVPRDPFAPGGRSLLRYRADGTVYSVGENGRDDGGRGDDDVSNW